ncbi:MAG TPA: glycosyltransferase [Puia sp.]|nr:glycosyltransferase [Puia sp.]
MSKKTIIYIAPAFPVGGAEKFLILLANTFTKDVRSQIVVSLSDDNKAQDEFNKVIRFLPLPRTGKFDFAPLRSLRRLIRTEKPDIIFCLNFFSFFLTKLIISGLKQKPLVIVSYHSTIPRNKKENNLNKLYTTLLTKKDLIITVSENQAKYTALKYHIPAKLFKTIHNGIDINKWRLPDDHCDKTKLRNQYGIPENASVIIMTAAFRPEKNHIGAIQSLQVLHSAYNQKAYLLFVGGGTLLEQCRLFAEKMNMSEFIKFTGPQSDVRPFYWASNLFTLCSTSVETFSIAALEAMACGLPVVLTNIGGASEMISEGLNGFLCEPDVADIAHKWSKALQFDFSAEKIHEYISLNFSAEKMIGEYTKTLQLVEQE